MDTKDYIYIIELLDILAAEDILSDIYSKRLEYCILQLEKQF